MTNFGIIGCGTIARRFAKALAAAPDATLCACAARDLDRAQAFANDNGAQHAYGSYQELINDPQVQAVYIATIHTTHAAIARDCISAGKAVLCEKPFFTNSREAEEVIALARERGVLVMEGFWTRIQPAYLKVKDWIREGRIGDVRLIRAAFCFPFPYNERTLGHRLWDKSLGGGALLDVGVYPYMYVTGIMDGPPEGFSATVQRVPTGADATVLMSMKYPDAVADCLTSIAGYMDDCAIIGGSGGYIKQHRFWGSRQAELFGLDGKLLDSFTDPQEEGFVHEIAHFVGLLGAGETESPLVPLDDTLDFARRVDGIELL